LEFGSWVAGRKLLGPGARSALPKGSDVDEILGTNYTEIKSKLKETLSPFNYKS
jgi:hypothetical protein